MKDNEPSPKTAYEVRTVAFIDILGFSALVARSVEDRNFLTNLYQAVRVVENQGRIWAALSLSSPGASVEQAGEILTAMDFRSHAFSDCLILSQRGAMVGPLFISVAQLAMALLNLGVLVRGGIAQGLLYHDPSVVFGPALIDAYYLESKCAKFPRILVSQGVCDASHKEILHIPSEGSQAVYFMCELLRRDADRLYHLDYLTSTLFSPSSVIGADTSQFLNLLKRTASLTVDEFNRPSQRLETKAKWGWFLDYFNDFVRVRTSHLPELAIEPLVLEDDEMDPVVTWDNLRRAFYRRDTDSASG
jgi:hypothetical protein